MTPGPSTTASSPAPLSVGLVGAGPWAERAYAPMLAAGPETRLAGVWARRPEAARSLAEAHGSAAAESFEVLLERCDAVAFAVPPDVQADLAVRAAHAGRHLMLDKPLALDLDGARRVVAAVEASGVVTQLMLTHRFRPQTRDFLERARSFEALGARFTFLSGSMVAGPYATPWRREHGALLDLGPHALDLLIAAVGPIIDIVGRGHPRRWVSLVCTHANGVVSELALSGVMTLPKSVCRLELFGATGSIEFDAVAAASDEPWSAARRSFVAAVRSGRSPELDARHGLVLQELMDRAARSMGL